MTSEVLSVPGISCDHCRMTIESALGGLPGVEAVTVDVPAKTVQVRYDEAKVSPEAVRATLAEEGYEVAG